VTENSLPFHLSGSKIIDFKNDDYPTAHLPVEVFDNIRYSRELNKKYSNPTKSKNRKYSTQWAWADKEERYDQDIANGITHTYKKDEFYYDINANGFRCDDFDTMDFTKKSIIYLGCSYTYGVGLPDTDTWPSMFHDKIQKEHNTTYNYINLGVPGGGIDYYLHFLPYFSKFNPALIVSATPEITRMVMIEDDYFMNDMSIGTIDVNILRKKTLTQIERAYDRLVQLGDNYFEYRKEIIFANIRAYAKSHHTEFLDVDVNSFENNSSNEEIARDNVHFSSTSHKVLVEMMINKIKGNQ
jgi:lysophospholipase L1-like esterase